MVTTPVVPVVPVVWAADVRAIVVCACVVGKVAAHIAERKVRREHNKLIKQSFETDNLRVKRSAELSEFPF